MAKAKAKAAQPAAVPRTQPDCINGEFLVSFGAQKKLSEQDVAAMSEMLTWTDAAIGRMVKHQMEKRLRQHREAPGDTSS